MYVCTTCGTMHDEPDAVCCSEAVVSFEKAFWEQGQLFELSGNEKAASVLHTLQSGYEATAKRVSDLKKKLFEAELLRDESAKVLLAFYQLTRTED